MKKIVVERKQNSWKPINKHLDCLHKSDKNQMDIENKIHKIPKKTSIEIWYFLNVENFKYLTNFKKQKIYEVNEK